MSMYFKTPNYSVAMNAKVASSTLARAIISNFWPDQERLIQNAAYPEGTGPDSTPVHWLCPKEDSPSRPVITLIRNPIDRFRSAMAQLNLTDVDQAIHSLETDTQIEFPRKARSLRADPHFRHQHALSVGDSTVYRVEDIDVAAQVIGLSLPLPAINEASNPKPELTQEQEARVLAFYAEDKALYDSIFPGEGLAYLYEPLPVSDPVAPVPGSVTATQIRLWLVRNGISMDQVSAAISAIEDQQERSEAEVLWEYAPYVERTNPLVAAIAGGFGMSDQAVDQAFREASAL
jgi:hypothetical protein